MSDISVAHASVSASSSLPEPETASLRANVPELGESLGASRRIEIVYGVREEHIENMCGIGLKMDRDGGIDKDRVGERAVGGSILFN